MATSAMRHWGSWLCDAGVCWRSRRVSLGGPACMSAALAEPVRSHSQRACPSVRHKHWFGRWLRGAANGSTPRALHTSAPLDTHFAAGPGVPSPRAPRTPPSFGPAQPAAGVRCGCQWAHQGRGQAGRRRTPQPASGAPSMGQSVRTADGRSATRTSVRRAARGGGALVGAGRDIWASSARRTGRPAPTLLPPIEQADARRHVRRSCTAAGCGGRRAKPPAHLIVPRRARLRMGGTLCPVLVADYFITNAVGSLTPLQVIKMVYIAHGYSLALLDEPLVEEAVEAWRYGPVLPSVYHTVKKCEVRSPPPKHHPHTPPRRVREGVRGALP